MKARLSNPGAGLILAVALFTHLGSAKGQSAAEIVEQAPWVSSINSEANPLIGKLEQEVRKIVSAGHLMPFRAQYGEDPNRYGLNGADHAYDEPWMMMLTLARAYPYLSPERQGEVIQYLKTESTNYPPWADQPLGADGFYRQADLAGVAEIGLPNQDYKRRGTMLYALWLYGHKTGDWSIMDNQWANLKNIYGQMKNAAKSYELVSGAIAIWRLAVHFGESSQILTQYENEAVLYLNDGLDYPAFRAAANQDYSQDSSWNRGTFGVVYPLFHLTPEVARFMVANPSLKSSIDADISPKPTGQINGWVLPYAALIEYPFWWMAQGPSGDAGYFGECSSVGPHVRMMLYNYLAWVRGESPQQLVYWLDVPDALLGDCYYLQHLVTAIESFGTTSWQNVQQSSNNHPPLVTIATPKDRASFQVGDSIALSGSATDSEDGAIPANSLVWASQIEGLLGSGANLSTSTLSVGRHMIVLQATDSGGFSGWDTVMLEVSGSSGNVPDAPQNLQATPGDAQVSLQWQPSAQALAYRLYRSNQSGGPYLKIGQTAGDQLVYTDLGLQNGTAYFYVATALGAGGVESPYSNQATATPQDGDDGGAMEDMAADGEVEGGSDERLAMDQALADGVSGTDESGEPDENDHDQESGFLPVMGSCGCSSEDSLDAFPALSFLLLAALRWCGRRTKIRRA